MLFLSEEVLLEGLEKVGGRRGGLQTDHPACGGEGGWVGGWVGRKVEEKEAVRISYSGWMGGWVD